MFTNSDIQKLKGLLPYDYKERINSKTKLSYITIDRFFLLIKIRDGNAVKIFEAATEVIIENKALNSLRIQKAQELFDLTDKD